MRNDGHFVNRVPSLWCTPREPETLWFARQDGRCTDRVIVGLGEFVGKFAC